MRLLSATEVCELLSSRDERLSYPTLHEWITRGVVIPVKQAGGKGRERRFNFMNVLSLAVARAVRGLGYSIEVAAAVHDALAAFATEDQLLAEFEAGRTYLMLCGANVYPALVSRETLLSAISEGKRFVESLPLHGVQPEMTAMGINVEPAYKSLCKAVENLRPRRRKVWSR
ncbi:MAG: MerR family transcriptional regulator [Pirellulales bacterium]